MDRIDLQLPDDLAAFVEEQVAVGGHRSRQAYVAHLIRVEQAKKQLVALIEEGLDSPLQGPADKAYFDGLRERIRGHSRIGSSAAE